MPLTVTEILTLAFEAMNDVNGAIAFDKTIPADVVGIERDLRIAEFVFPNVLKLIREVVAASK